MPPPKKKKPESEEAMEEESWNEPEPLPEPVEAGPLTTPPPSTLATTAGAPITAPYNVASVLSCLQNVDAYGERTVEAIGAVLGQTPEDIGTALTWLQGEGAVVFHSGRWWATGAAPAFG